MTKREQNRIDKQIADIYQRRCSGVQINILDIGTIYAAGRRAAQMGTDIETAVLVAVSKVRQN